MPFSVLISPAVFLRAGVELDKGDTTTGVILIVIGVVLMSIGIYKCREI